MVKQLSKNFNERTLILSIKLATDMLKNGALISPPLLQSYTSVIDASLKNVTKLNSIINIQRYISDLIKLADSQPKNQKQPTPIIINQLFPHPLRAKMMALTVDHFKAQYNPIKDNGNLLMQYLCYLSRSNALTRENYPDVEKLVVQYIDKLDYLNLGTVFGVFVQSRVLTKSMFTLLISKTLELHQFATLADFFKIASALECLHGFKLIPGLEE